MQSATVFPIEVDLSEKTFNYNPSGQINDGLSDEEGSGSAVAGSAAASRYPTPGGAAASNDNDADLLDLS